SQRLAQRIHPAVPGLAEVYVYLAARIGEPVDHPWIDVQVVLHEGVALADVEAAVRATVEAEAEGFGEFRVRLSRGEFPVC
ncbi:MAG TPA: methionine adenosyltransferase, partial [Methylomirabilota bacterium]